MLRGFFGRLIHGDDWIGRGGDRPHWSRPGGGEKKVLSAYWRGEIWRFSTTKPWLYRDEATGQTYSAYSSLQSRVDAFNEIKQLDPNKGALTKAIREMRDSA